MGDEYDDFDDEFTVDDSFFEEVDRIAAQAEKTVATKSSTAQPPAANGNSANSIVAATASGSKSNTIARNTPSGPSRPSFRAGLPPQPSSEDFGDITFTPSGLAQIDDIARPSQAIVRNSTPSSSSRGSASRLGLGRPSSGSVQTHLNFRKESTTKKGKQWDRTAFAETGRRVKVDEGYVARKWGKEGEADEEEEEDFEPLVPGPKPLVDPRKSRLFSGSMLTLRQALRATKTPDRS